MKRMTRQFVDPRMHKHVGICTMPSQLHAERERRVVSNAVPLAPHSPQAWRQPHDYSGRSRLLSLGEDRAGQGWAPPQLHTAHLGLLPSLLPAWQEGPGVLLAALIRPSVSWTEPTASSRLWVHLGGRFFLSLITSPRFAHIWLYLSATC